MNTTGTAQEGYQRFIDFIDAELKLRKQDALAKARRALHQGTPRNQVVDRLAQRLNFIWRWSSFAEEDRQLARADADALLDEFLAQQRVTAH